MKKRPQDKSLLPPAHPSQWYLNRELGWLEFNSRVLHLSRNPQVPLLERVRFLSIVNSNLDEFFMKRVGSLKRAAEEKTPYLSADGLTPQEQLRLIRKRVLKMVQEQARVFQRSLKPALRHQGIILKRWQQLGPMERKKLKEFFLDQLSPILTPLIVDPSHPFPHISNLSTSLGVRLRDPESSEDQVWFARVKVPEALDQWVEVPRKSKGPRVFVSLVEIIQQNLQQLFPGMEILSVTPFRITRNLELGKDPEDAEDILEHVTEELRERKFADIVRLEHGPDFDPETIDLLKKELEISDSDIYQVPEPWDIDYCGLKFFYRLNRPDLKYVEFTSFVPPAFDTESSDRLFAAISSKDILVHHPFESFSDSVIRWIEIASRDPQVLAIKLTLYRTEENSPIILALKQALELGKQVVVLIELKASLDERRNIRWAKELESVGAHVCYGIVGLKIHAKLCLIVRKEAGGVKSYAHIGTGNYNSVTSKAYTDLSLFTAHKGITQEVREIFNYLTGVSKKSDYKHLLVAPINMESQLKQLIAQEADYAKKGKPSFIFAKMNNFDEAGIIKSLYEASVAGVPIEMVVRGFSTLRPRKKRLSENIWVRSILGRFLEHSRVFYFRCGKKNPTDGLFFIGSADWMGRNLHRRVECLVPIYDPDLKAELWRFIFMYLSHDVEHWQMAENGSYRLKPAAQGYPDTLHARWIDFYKSRYALLEENHIIPGDEPEES